MRPSPASGFIERFVWVRTMRPRAADKHPADILTAVLLKNVLLVLPAAENPLSAERRAFGAALRYFAPADGSVFAPRGIPPAPRRKPHPCRGLRGQRPHPRSTAVRRPGVSALPQRGLPAPATPDRSAARVPAKRKRCALYGGACRWAYGAGTRALTSSRAPSASA